MKKALCPLFPTIDSPMTEDRATALYGAVVYKHVLRDDGSFVRVINKRQTSPERVEVENGREQMLKNIAATYPIPRGIFSRKRTPQAVCA